MYSALEMLTDSSSILVVHKLELGWSKHIAELTVERFLCICSH